MCLSIVTPSYCHSLHLPLLGVSLQLSNTDGQQRASALLSETVKKRREQTAALSVYYQHSRTVNVVYFQTIWKPESTTKANIHIIV